jgi:hypothetical protein
VFAVIRAGREPGQDWHRLATGPIPLGRTGRDGTLRVGQFWACTACIGVRRSGGWIAAWREQEFQEEGTLALRLDALGEVTGRLVERWVSPHSPWLVTLEPRQQSPYLEMRRTVTGADGTFAFHDQAPGPYLLKAGHPDAPAIEVEVAAGQRRFVMLGVRPSHLDHDAPLRGRITIDGAAADGLLLRLTEQPRRDRQTRDQREPWADAMFTDKEGLFSFRPQARTSGSFELSVERLDRGVAQRITRTWWHGRADRLELDLRTGAARLDLSHRGGLPAGNRKVLLEQTGDGGARFEAVTTPRGFATIERVPVGEYTVHAEGCADLVEGGRAKLQVRAGEDTVARFVFR